ncbi:NADPH:quinone reductase [Pedobacter steynii]|uniref:NADPH:quinone reductase n=1 Tax=Pedobacter steynii TaxID=430522 RepID=A0A1H0A6H4_9SPHI|nr:NADP-dependent oxidoreductase [Pedobacter steynii]NQX41443.1 NADP-dependent oxidoreductase [Pedobacter steynii]SDN29218.1 NADPH:quinone reductase [Pedobacter steynii]
MKAIVLKEPGTADQLMISEISIPLIRDEEVLVEVKVIGINPIDIKTRKGKGRYERLKAENPIILGWDISGVVKASKSDLFKAGDEVFGMVDFSEHGHGKAYAEYVAAQAAHLSLKPKNISHQEAAGATLAALTAWQAIVKAGVKKGDRVLIHAAAGGVGHFAVQMAKHLGAFVAGTSSEKNKDFVLSLGADQHIDYAANPFETQVKDIDFVLDSMGTDHIDRSLEIMNSGGTLISIPSGLNAGVEEKSRVKGVNGYATSVQSSGEDMKTIAGLLEKGIVKSHISGSYPFDQMAAAHHQMESGRTVGKIVVTLP